jgi:hypothetical protein
MFGLQKEFRVGLFLFVEDFGLEDREESECQLLLVLIRAQGLVEREVIGQKGEG